MKVMDDCVGLCVCLRRGVRKTDRWIGGDGQSDRWIYIWRGACMREREREREGRA